jgi:glutamine synthetase
MTLAQRSGVHGAARQAACAALQARVREAGIEQLRVVWADLHGTLRSKTLVLDQDGTQDSAALSAALDDGVGLVSTLLLKDTADRTAFPVFQPGGLDGLDGFGPANNVLLLPDPASFQVLPWAPHTGWLRAQPLWSDGSAVMADPRGVLQRALAQLAQAGYGLRCGLEVEFHVYRITDDRLAAADAGWPAEPPEVRLVHPGYHLLSDAWSDLAQEPLDIVRRTVLGLGLPLRSLEIELGPSQVEAVFAPTDALTAADHMVLLRNGVRQALRRAGYHASFVCKPPLPHAVASGWHLHQSLVHLQGPGAGGNAFVRALAEGAAGEADDARQVLSDTGAHWLAGLLQHAPGMTALCAPTLPAYARYQGSVMAPQAVLWGRDNRGAALRVLGGPGDPATRIENRLGEPMANPYLMIAAQVLAGLDGLQRQLQPGPSTAHPYADGAARLPTSLAQALDLLQADTVLQRGLGPVMARVFDRVKRQECQRHAAAADAAQWERCEYFARY